MKLLRWIFVLLIFTGVVYAGVDIVRFTPGLKELHSSKSEKETELADVKEKLGDVNLKYRGFLESTDNIPDELRKAEAGRTMKMQKEYHKQIWVLERDERELKRLIRKDQARISEMTSAFKYRMFVTGGLILVFLAGAIITNRAAIRS